MESIWNMFLFICFLSLLNHTMTTPRARPPPAELWNWKLWKWKLWNLMWNMWNKVMWNKVLWRSNKIPFLGICRRFKMSVPKFSDQQLIAEFRHRPLRVFAPGICWTVDTSGCRCSAMGSGGSDLAVLLSSGDFQHLPGFQETSNVWGFPRNCRKRPTSSGFPNMLENLAELWRFPTNFRKFPMSDSCSFPLGAKLRLQKL